MPCDTGYSESRELLATLPESGRLRRRITAHREAIAALRKLLKLAVERDRAIEAIELAEEPAAK